MFSTLSIKRRTQIQNSPEAQFPIYIWKFLRLIIENAPKTQFQNYIYKFFTLSIYRITLIESFPEISANLHMGILKAEY